jgi:DNA mismatch endonuclease (patch repair protein)
MARVRSKNTGGELRLREALYRQGLRYRLHRKLPGTPDLVFVSARIAVFVDGCFWHGCPEHYTAPASNMEFWQAKLERNRARDGRVDSELVQAGWTVIRVWEHSIYTDADQVAKQIARVVRTRLR